ncbi:hypothetical protein [Bdellovibrio sp.]|uniref:hypothetical protein n=1 Tax=Bdellovibrio sp. TaxID=28201 RepID=UPI0039E6C56F
MSLADWAKNGWLRPHTPSKGEVKNLFEIVERDLKDAVAKEISDDWKFGIAYNAALKLCTILLHTSGYRPEKNLAHYRTLQALPLILGDKHKANADYLDACRKKRNETEYDFAGTVSKEEAQELINFCSELKDEVSAWLKKNHKDLK